MRSILLAGLLLLSVFVGCKSSGVQSVPSAGEFTVESCVGLNDIADPCYWRFESDPTRCSAGSPCTTLVIGFSGGEMFCDDSVGNPDAVYSKALARYAANGYVAVCAGAFLTNELSATVPFHLEGPRIDNLIKAIRDSEAIKALWTGEALLFAGVSHGATAPAVVMARGALDDQDSWKGSETTAACFHDGTYDVLDTDAFLRGSPLSCGVVRDSAICRRYFGNASTNCEVPSLADENVAADTIVDVSPSELAITDWKIVECGSALPAPECGIPGDPDRDWLPASTMDALCTNIDGAPTHSCAWDPQPNDGHLSCFGTDDGVDKCRLWFDSLLP